ncbi:MAG: phospho-N-acetylmuramoyl-pentapeptide-transferase [Clostridia bacterium]|nr:phospho-N-acetylmuramoyl-pentapeptide-transferase [Clostridia bacterium]
MKFGLLNLVLCFFVSLMISPVIIKWLKKLKFGQSILVYVEQHKGKSGTPTMGGIVFIISSILGLVVFWSKNNTFAVISIMSMLFFGVLGFLDDYIKIKYKHNEGLKPYQKILGQLGIASVLAVYIYLSGMNGGVILIPFSHIEWNIGWGIIPFVIIFYVAVVNSVNLIDGLDGLCGGVSSVVIFAFSIILVIISGGIEGVVQSEFVNLSIVLLGVVGAVLGFLCFNWFPAKVFMGDTGSLALGGLLASSFALSGQYLLILILGFAFVLTSVSVILQVVSYKLTKKRIFKMSPIHHHFESSSHEAKVTILYVIMTIILCVLTISLYL